MVKCDFSSAGNVSVGSRIYLGCGDHFPQGCPFVKVSNEARKLRAGMKLVSEGCDLLRIISVSWADQVPGAKTWVAEVLDVLPDTGNLNLKIEKIGYSVAYVTLSDKGAAGQREDRGGPLIAEIISDSLPVSAVHGFLIPDEYGDLKSLLMHLAYTSRFDLIITTGGTGVGPRDISPEATLAVIEKRLPGFERAITATGLAKTPHSMISRGVAGTLGDSIIINVPGSPKAVKESLEAIIPALKHAIDKLQGDISDCANIA
ncbi:molybdenum cofactor biosynthesis protein B [Maridesulfovibrio ferrireducens]|uniref:MogA/MoaB family molybdenum cofactor biosynthesis protein n=1 Tax=Maridesulfovibrio ferrireducens TaxID=246191 RepID=UPI001A1F91C5|nr:MogA/MoaB family molybdenum cofactor biosynthesis protein [Maridesulfovibrio ferrireducens]MBI9111504.1 MogA/MoaB family molybdenum cofactor biosynthesis protein [Maridesulfovibrio ferrireducens]